MIGPPHRDDGVAQWFSLHQRCSEQGTCHTMRSARGGEKSTEYAMLVNRGYGTTGVRSFGLHNRLLPKLGRKRSI